MRKILLVFTLFISGTAFAEEKTYELTDAEKIQKLLNETSCIAMIMHGEADEHPVESALLAGWHIGKVKVTDVDGEVYIWREDANEYRMKRLMELTFMDSKGMTKLVLRTKECGVDPVRPKTAVRSIWRHEDE